MSDSLVENRVLLRGRCDLPTPRQPVETLPCDQLIAVAWDSSHRFQHDPVCGPQEDYQDDELGSPRNADACDDGLFRPWPGAGLEATVTGSPRGRSGYFGLSVHSQGEGKDARVLLVGAAERPRPGIVIKVLNEAHHGPTTYEPDPEGCPP